MKVFLIAVLVASALCQANLTGLDCEYIPQKQSLMNVLNIDVLDDVKRESGCGNEFKAYGTCCSLDSLKTRSAALAASLTAGVNTLKSEFGVFAKAVSDLDTLVKALADNNPIPEDERYTKELNLAKTLRDSKAFNFLRSYFTAAKSADFGSALDKCWGDVTKVRNSALCALCAGRSSAFVFNQNNLVIQDKDCSGMAFKCRDSLENIRSFAQGLTLYANVIHPLLPSTLEFNTDVSRINRNNLAALFSVVNSDKVDEGLKSSNPTADGIVCSTVLSAGKPTLVEAFVSVFNPNANFAVFSQDNSIHSKAKTSIARVAYEKNILLSNMSTPFNVPLPVTTDVNKLITEIKARFANLTAASRRRRLQILGQKVGVADFKAMLEELKQATASSVNPDYFGLSPTFVPAGVGLGFGSNLNRHLGDDFRIVAESNYKLVMQSKVASYVPPFADNPPAFSRTGILDPVVMIPIDLTIS
jgi:hypothetical protein